MTSSPRVRSQIGALARSNNAAMTLGDDMSKIAKTELSVYALIAEAERWGDSVEPYREDMSETEKAWRLGFAAAMQRIEMAAIAARSDA